MTLQSNMNTQKHGFSSKVTIPHLIKYIKQRKRPEEGYLVSQTCLYFFQLYIWVNKRYTTHKTNKTFHCTKNFLYEEREEEITHELVTLLNALLEGIQILLS